MIDKEVLVENLPKVKGQYRLNFRLSPLTWFKVGGECEVFYKPRDLEDLVFFLYNLSPKVSVFTIGAGSNLLIRDKIDGVVIKLGSTFTQISLKQNELVIGAGCLNYNVAQFCLQNNITGFEFLVGIPGTIGGGIAMNAGAYGREFKDIINSITTVDRNGKIITFNNENIGFQYRKNNLSPALVYIEARCKYSEGKYEYIRHKMHEIQSMREQTQPIKEKTCGSTFANPVNHKAWELIEEVNLIGKTIGGAQVSRKHCNFLINTGTATSKDIEDLGELIRQKVLSKFNVELQWEIKRIGHY